MKKTKILATIGPSSWKPKILRKLITNGVDGIRINTAHGTKEEYSMIIKRVRSIKDTPIVLDIKGPDLRVKVKDKLLIKRGKEHDIKFNFNISKKVKKGDTIYFDNGSLKGKIVKRKKNSLVIKFNESGIIEDNKGVNIPCRGLDLPSLTKKDKEMIKFAKKHKVAFIALSFVRAAKDVTRLRKLLHKGCQIISKIESREGVENICEIIEATDGIMIARGDLGVELDLEKVPMIQKKIIHECSQQGKLVITATQMLESMMNSNTPTRAEVSDIANAILDGTDCLMLSEETAIGNYPLESVKMMKKVCVATEDHRKPLHINNVNKSLTAKVSQFSFDLARGPKINTIITLTSSGYSARMISRFKSEDSIIAVTNNEYTRKQLELHYGVQTIHCTKKIGDVKSIAKLLLRKKLILKKDRVLFTKLVSRRGEVKLIQDIHYVRNL